MSNTYLISVGESDKNRMDAMCKVFNLPCMDILKKYITRNVKSLLDVGCGNGGLTSVIAQTYPEVKCLGIDRSPEQIALARSRDPLPNLQYEIHDVYKFSDRITITELDKFDIVHMRFLLTHLRDPVEVARNLLKFVNPGGMLIMTEANGGACNFSKYPRAAEAWCNAFTVQHILQGSSLVTVDKLIDSFNDCDEHHIIGMFDTPEKKVAMSEGVRLACKILTSGAIPEEYDLIKKYKFENPETWIKETDELVADPEFTFQMNPVTIVVHNHILE